jgi:hypothetical protein
MNTDNENSPFGEVIFSYTRSQAVADGVQVEVSPRPRRKPESVSRFFSPAPFMTLT